MASKKHQEEAGWLLASPIPGRFCQRTRTPLRSQGRRRALARPDHHSHRHRAVRRPEAGKITFADFYDECRRRQVWVAGTRRSMDITDRSVTFGGVALRSLRRSRVEGWVKSMAARGLAAWTIATRANNVRAVLRGALADRVIPVDTIAGVSLPRRRRREAAMTLPAPSDARNCWTPTTPHSVPSSRFAPSPDCDQARSLGYKWVTSTSHAERSTCPARYSAARAASNSGRQSTALSARCSWPVAGIDALGARRQLGSSGR
jgi:hypothetical protein